MCRRRPPQGSAPRREHQRHGRSCRVPGGAALVLLVPRDLLVDLPLPRVDPGLVLVVPLPPLVRSALGVPLGRVLPVLLAPERAQVEVAPGAAERLVAAVVDEVGAVHLVALADEGVGAVPLVDAEV